MQHQFLKLISFSLFLGLLSPSLNAQLALEFDINQKPSGSNPRNFIHFDNDLYFSATDGAFGIELWKHDLDTDETTRITDLNLYSENSNIAELYIFQDKLFMHGVGPQGQRLFSYDPVSGETTQIGGASIRSPYSLIAFEDMLYFTAMSTGNNTRLYRYNPTLDEIELVLDLNPDVNNDNISQLVILNNTLYFSGNDQIDGSRLWSLNTSTFESTPIDGASGIGQPIAYNNKLYFSAQDDQDLGSEPFEYDPSTGIFRMLMNISPGASHSSPNQFRVVGNKLVFSAKIYLDSELWVYDGTSDMLSQLAEINTDESAFPNLGNVHNDILYFSATSNEYGRELYSYNPANDEINLILDHSPGLNSGNINGCIAIDGKVYFSGFSTAIDQELFVFDINDETDILVKDINTTTASSNPNSFTTFENKLYFIAREEFTGREIWVYDPITGSTDIFLDHTPGIGNSDPTYFQEFDNRLFVTIYFPDLGEELGYYDETSNEIKPVTDTYIGNNGGHPDFLTPFQNKLYFTSRVASGDDDLFAYSPITDTVETITEADVQNLFVFNDEMYCTFNDEAQYGSELYKVDVSTGELELVVDINEGPDNSGPDEFIEHQGKLYFVAYDPSNSIQLRSYDPVTNETSTHVLGNGNSNANWLTEYNGFLFMAGKQTGGGNLGTELYRFDASTATFELAADIYEGSGQSNPHDLIVFNDKLYFSANTAEHGSELWEFDAQTGEAQILTDIWAGPSDSDPFYMTLFNDKLYFAADDGNHGTEVWSLASCLNTFLTTEPEVDGNAEGSIDLSVLGGTPPYSYSWSSGAHSQDISNLEAGEYTVTVVDDAGCISVLTGRVEATTPTLELTIQNLYISPNPAHHFIQFDLNLDQKTLSGNSQLEIYDSFGKIIRKKQVSNNGLLQENISDFPSGRYTVFIKNEDKILSGKFVKVE